MRTIVLALDALLLTDLAAFALRVAQDNLRGVERIVALAWVVVALKGDAVCLLAARVAVV